MAGQRVSFNRLYNPLLLNDRNNRKFIRIFPKSQQQNHHHRTTKNITNSNNIIVDRYEYSIRQRR